jgi:hypothetical protein|tara:strand:- start:3596 stop:3880 length:285 start_codon:yes stop_codon:yes gene_type:complete
MATNKTDAIHFMKIVLDWCSPQVARSMMDDLDFYIAEVTDNDSVKESIKMVRQLIYDGSEENLKIAQEEKTFMEQVAQDAVDRLMLEQRGMTRE